MIFPISMLLRSRKKEVNALKRFFIVLTILFSSKLAYAQDNKLDTASSNFQPSLFVVIGVLSFMFSLTFILLLYAKMCYREPTAIHINNTNQNRHSNRGMFGVHTRFSGLNVDVVEALPFFRFSSLRGAKQGLQCSVCLAEFEDVEVLRLLPKCKHGFHIECIDKWFESHSTCPLCRQKVSVDDVNSLINSSFSMRLIMEGKSEPGEASSNFEIFVEREDEQVDQRSIRFNIGESFRRIVNSSKKKEELLPRQNVEECDLHKVNHRILVSDVVFKNRWSDVSSSDLMFLNSEMLGVMSSDRIASSIMSGGNCNSSSSSIMNIKEEMERKIMFENKISHLKRSSSSISSSKMDTSFEGSRRVMMDQPRTRAMSEIASVSRFKDLRSMKNKIRENEFNDENIKRRKKWFQIAKRTVQWFANREHSRSQESQEQVFDV